MNDFSEAFNNGQNINFKADEIILKEGTPSEFVYLITQGLVRVYTLNEEGQEINLAIRGKGEMIGVYSMLLDEEHGAQVQALKETQVKRLKKDEFKQILLENREWGFKLLSYLAKQIRQENKYLQRILTTNLENRVWKTIKRIAASSADSSISLTHDQLSKIVGATRPRITEVLNKLLQEGKIKIEKGRTIVLIRPG